MRADAGGADAVSGGGGRSAGCGKAKKGTGTFVEQPRLAVAGMQRLFYLYVPRTYDPERAYPLVFGWHAAGGNGRGGGTAIANAAKEDAIVVSPEGHATPFGNGWDFAPQGPDMLLFDALLARLEGEYCVDTKRVYSYGFSFGGGMSLALGCARGDKLRAIGDVAGGFLQPSTPPKTCVGHVAAFVVQGLQDTIVTAAHAANIRDTMYLPHGGCAKTSKPTAPAPCVQYDGCRAGHPYVWCGTQSGHGPQDPFASTNAWAFWKSLPPVDEP